MPASNPAFRKPLFWLLVCLAGSFFVLAYPLYVIRPFRYQGPRELAAALLILRIRPELQIVLAVLAICLAVWCWNRSRRVLTRVSSALAALAVVALGLLSRVNVYELMFNPINAPAYAAAGKTNLDGAEQVIAIRMGKVARAYPIRVISYHHMVNDVVAGIPVVATY